MANITLEPLASSDAVLSFEEKEAGVALIDIGVEQLIWQFLKMV